MVLRDGSATGGSSGRGDKATPKDGTRTAFSGAETTDYINRCWDPGAGGGYESWTTRGFIDYSGGAYPDPHGSGWAACSDKIVAGIVYYDKVI